MEMDMQYGNRYAACTWTFSMDMDMQHGHGHAAWTWTYSMSMDMDMQHGHGMQYGQLVGHCSAVLSSAW
jgi:hypothetical protein